MRKNHIDHYFLKINLPYNKPEIELVPSLSLLGCGIVGPIEVRLTSKRWWESRRSIHVWELQEQVYERDCPNKAMLCYLDNIAVYVCVH